GDDGERDHSQRVHRGSEHTPGGAAPRASRGELLARDEDEAYAVCAALLAEAGGERIELGVKARVRVRAVDDARTVHADVGAQTERVARRIVEARALDGRARAVVRVLLARAARRERLIARRSRARARRAGARARRRARAARAR